MLLKLGARRKHARTANCSQRAIQKSHIILYQLNYHHDEVIAASRCGLDICITISKYDVNCSVIWLLTTLHQKVPISIIQHTVYGFALVHVYMCV